MGSRTIHHQPSPTTTINHLHLQFNTTTTDRSAPLFSNRRTPRAGIGRCLIESAWGILFPMRSRWQKSGKCRPRCKKTRKNTHLVCFRSSSNQPSARPLRRYVDAHFFIARRTQRTHDIVSHSQLPSADGTSLITRIEGERRHGIKGKRAV